MTEVSATSPMLGNTGRRDEDGYLEPVPRVEKGSTAEDLKRILVVEDESHVRELLLATLGQDYEVQGVANGAEAVQVALSWLPHLILLDVLMPGMDGIATCRALRANPVTTATPVILLSGLGDQETIRCGLEAGANSYFVKPFKPRLLLESVRQILDSLGGQAKIVVASEIRAPLEEIEHEQLLLYAQELGFLYLRERQLREELERVNRELENRLRELTSLNVLFQKHLAVRFRTEEGYKQLLAGVRSLLEEAEKTLSQVEEERALRLDDAGQGP